MIVEEYHPAIIRIRMGTVRVPSVRMVGGFAVTEWEETDRFAELQLDHVDVTYHCDHPTGRIWCEVHGKSNGPGRYVP